MRNKNHSSFSSQDLSSLSELFQKYYEAYQQMSFSMHYIQNPSVKKVYQTSICLFDKELKTLIQVLKNPDGDINELL